MSWFSERHDEYEEEVKRLHALEAAAPSLFDDLWREVLAIAAEAEVAGVTLNKTEAPGERTLTVASSPLMTGALSAAGEPLGVGKKLVLRLELTNEKRAVTADAGSGVQDFPFAVDAKDKVELTLNNEVQTPQEVAEKVMSSFLFSADGPFALQIKKVD